MVDDTPSKPRETGFSLRPAVKTAQERFQRGTTFSLLEFRVPGWPLLHGHDYYEFMYVESGTGKHIIGYEVYDVTPGSFFMLKPGEMHKLLMRPAIDIHFLNLEFTPAVIEPESEKDNYRTFMWEEIKVPAEELGKRPVVNGVRCKGEAAREIMGALSGMFAEARDRRPYWKRLVFPHLDLLLGALARARSERNLESLRRETMTQSLWKAISFIDARFCEEINVEEVCRECGLSRSSLTRQFRNRLETSVLEYVLDLRLTKAMVNLWSGNSVSETAYECGFGDPGYMWRVFKKRLGMSPASFRESRPGYTALYAL